MDITGERRIPAPQQKVWQALTNAQVLEACLPGCLALDRVSDHSMNGIVQARFGGLPVRLAGTLTVTEPDTAHGAGLFIEARDRKAGHLSAQIGISMAGEGPFTVLRYHAAGTAGGDLARLPGVSAQNYINEFLDRFANDVAAPAEVGAAGPAGVIAAAANSSADQHNPPAILAAFAAMPLEIGGFPIVFWLGSALFLCIFLLVFSAYL
jgi:uncharacterized protein